MNSKELKRNAEKGCDFCLHSRSLNGDNDVGKIRIIKGTLCITYSDEFYNMETSISSCPICSRKLEK